MELKGLKNYQLEFIEGQNNGLLFGAYNGGMFITYCFVEAEIVDGASDVITFTVKEMK